MVRGAVPAAVLGLLLCIPSSSPFAASLSSFIRSPAPSPAAARLFDGQSSGKIPSSLGSVTRTPGLRAPVLRVSMIDSAVVDLGVGALSGAISTAIVFPVETAKTKLQMADQGCNSTGQAQLGIGGALKQVVKEDGVSGLYKGLAPVLLGSAPECAIQLTIYEKSLAMLQGYEHISGNPAPMQAMMAGAAAGLCQVVATNPLEVLKMKAISNSSNGLVKDVQELGVKGLFHGVKATWLRDVPFAAMYFPAFSLSKATFESVVFGGLAASMVAGIGSGMLAAFVTTPADVIKTQIQMRAPAGDEEPVAGQAEDDAVGAVGKRIVDKQGWQALFLGAKARVGRLAPQMAISQSLFHNLQQQILRPVFKPMGTVLVAQTPQVVVETAQTEVMALSPQLTECGAGAVASEALAEGVPVQEVITQLCSAASNIAEVAAQQAPPSVAAATELAQQAAASVLPLAAPTLPVIQQAAAGLP